MAPLNIVIVGAGTAGPAAAIGLAGNGHRVTIYERSTTGQEVGYAFRLTPNSDRCPKHLGIDTVGGGAVAANRARIFNSHGELLREANENTDPEMAKKATSVFAYRPQLVKQLMDAALSSGVQIETGVKVTSVDVDNTSLTLDSGATVSADLIIGADGVHSAIRPAIIDCTKHFPKRTANQNAIRFMLPRSVVQNDPTMSSLVSDELTMFSWIEGSIINIVYPVDHGKLFNVTINHPAHLSDKEADKEQDNATATSYNHKVSFETVRDVHKGWDPRAIRLLELADPEGFRIWQLMDMDELPRCSRNYTALLGDACHPVLPHSFSGASMAIEDAITLSEFLERDVERKEIPGLLKLCEDVRKPRVARVRERARQTAEGTGGEGRAEYMQFLAGHDAVQFAKERLAEYKRKRSQMRTGKQEEQTQL
ncbi:hypothetical protein HO133_010305 [Letharia lupina]|uniref:FAD-binding domain-containing protein n=1 Tax=Letharia lupina TaxID=560253 RepID=A0A8H6FEQ4_9LECA|nr:uncharacterized protein HO133_010305 [Letharia lupina]KAF6225109.1 hypothetical protein HO133_010305 [Letharia lupina]